MQRKLIVRVSQSNPSAQLGEKSELWLTADNVRKTTVAEIVINLRPIPSDKAKHQKNLDIESVLIIIGIGTGALIPVFDFIVNLVKAYGTKKRRVIVLKNDVSEIRIESEEALDDLQGVRDLLEYSARQSANDGEQKDKDPDSTHIDLDMEIFDLDDPDDTA